MLITGILNARLATINRAMPALVEIFGVERAMEVAISNPNLLSSRTIQAAVPALVQVGVK